MHHSKPNMVQQFYEVCKNRPKIITQNHKGFQQFYKEIAKTGQNSTFSNASKCSVISKKGTKMLCSKPNRFSAVTLAIQRGKYNL